MNSGSEQQTQRDNVAALCILVLVQGIFSIWPVLIVMALQEQDIVATIIIYRDFFAVLSLWFGVYYVEPYVYPTDSYGRVTENYSTALQSVFAFFRNPLDAFGLDKSEYTLHVGLGIASAINCVGYLFALKYITPFNSALLHPTIPVFAFIIGAYLNIESLNKSKISGALMSIVGSIIVVVSQSNLQLSSSLYGNALLICQSLAMATLLVGQKFVSTKHTPLKITAIYYTIGTFISSPLCLLYIMMSPNATLLIEGNTILITLFGSLFVVTFNYVALTYCNKLTSPSVPAASMMLQPLFTYILGYLILGQQINGGFLQLLGGLLVVMGLLFLTVFSHSSAFDSHYTTVNDDTNQILQYEYNNHEYDFNAWSKWTRVPMK